MSRHIPLLQKSSRKTLRTFLASAGTLVCSFAALEAANSVSINFGGTDVTAGSAGAVSVGASNWNNTANAATGTLDNLKDSTGSTTGISVNWESKNTYGGGGTTATGNGQLTKRYLDDGNLGDDMGAKVVVSNIGYFLSNVYLIVSSDQSGATSQDVNYRSYLVNGQWYAGGTGTTVASDAAGVWQGKNWVDSDGALVEGIGGSYIKVENVASSVVTIRGRNSGTGRGAIAGVQIENAYAGTVLVWNGGATGAWDMATAKWRPDGAGSDQAWMMGTSQVAAFAATTDVSISGVQSADGIWTQSGDISLSGGGLMFNASSPALVRVDEGSTLTLSDTTIGGASMNVSGTIIIGSTGAVNLTGGLTGGTFDMSDSGSLLVLNADKNFTAKLTGSGSSAGRVELQGNSVFSLANAMADVFQGTIHVGTQATLTTTASADWAATVKTVNVEGNISFSVDGAGWSELRIAGGTLILSNTAKIIVSGTGSGVGSTYQIVTLESGANISFSGNIADLLEVHGRASYSLEQNALGLLITMTDMGQITWTGSGSNAWTTNTSVTNWKTATLDNQYFIEGDYVLFGDTGAGTVVVTGIIKPGSWTINNSDGHDYVFQAAGGDTANNYVSGGTGLVKQGAGKATIQTVNNFTGAVSIENGILEVGTGGKLGGGAVTIATDGTLLFNQPAGVADLNSVVGTTSGDGILAFTGGGTYVMGNARDKFTQSNTLVAGAGTILKLGTLATNDGGTGIIRGTLTITDGGTVNAVASNASGWNGDANKINIVNIDHGTLINSSAGDFGWETVYNLTGGKMESSGTGRFSMGSGTAAENKTTVNVYGADIQSEIAGLINVRQDTLTFNVGRGSSAVDLLVSAQMQNVSGQTNITKTGSGIMVLASDNTYKGVTTVSDGILQVGNGGTTGNLGTGAGVAAGNAALVVESNGRLVFNYGSPVTTTVNGISGGGIIQLSAGQTFIPKGATTSFFGTFDVPASATLKVDSSAQDVVLSASTVNILGNIEFTLSGTHYNSLAAGTVTFATGAKINLVGAAAAGSYRIISSGDASYSGNWNDLITNSGRIHYSLTKDDEGLLLVATGTAGNLEWTAAGSNAWKSNDSTLTNWKDSGSAVESFYDGDTVNFADVGVGTVDITGSVAPGIWNVSNATGTYTFSGTGKITGVAGLTKTGAGTMIILTNNDYTGAVSITGGTVQVGDGTTGGSLGGSGNITLATGASLVYKLPVDYTFTQKVLGGGTFVKEGTNNINMGAGPDGTYAAVQGNEMDIIINAGTITMTFSDGHGFYADGFFSGNRKITINDGGKMINVKSHPFGPGPNNVTVQLNDSGTWELRAETNFKASNLIMNGGKLTGVGQLRINNEGDVQVIGAGAVIENPVALNTGNIGITVNSSADLTISGIVSGSNPLTKKGAGVLILSGENTYTGLTTISEGILQLGNGGATGAISTSSGITINPGTTLAISRSDALYDYSGPALAGVAGNPAIPGTGSTILIKSPTTFTVSDANKDKFTAFGGDFVTESGSTFTGGLNFASNNLTVGGNLQPGGIGTVGTMEFKNVTFTATGVGVFDLNLSNSTTDKVTVNGNLTLDVASKIQPRPNDGATPPDSDKTFVLFTYTGNLVFSGGDLSALIDKLPAYDDYEFSLANDTGTKSIILTIAEGAGRLIWTGTGDSIWANSASINWTNKSVPAPFVDGSHTTFDDTGIAHNGVVINSTVTPKSWTISNTGGTYTFSGTGKITGATGLTKSGAGTAVILTQNDFTGAVVIDGGILQIGDGTTDGKLAGSGVVTVAQDSQLVYKLSGTGESTLQTLMGADRTITGAGTLVKDGANTITIDKAGLYLQSATIVRAGTLKITGGGDNTKSGLGGVLTVESGATLLSAVHDAVGYGTNKLNTANINGGTLHNSAGSFGWGVTYNLNGASLIADTGADFTMGGGTTVNVTGNTQTTISGAGKVNIREGNVNSNLVFNVSDGAAAVDLLVSAEVSGAAANNLYKTGAGFMEISGVGSYTGKTIVNVGTLKFSNATGPSTSALELASGAKLDMGSGTLTLNNTGASFAGSTTTNADITGSLKLTGGHTLDIGSGAGTIATLAVSQTLTLENSTLKFDFASGGSTFDKITVDTLVANTGTNNISLLFSTPLGVGQYTLISGTSAASINLANLTLLGIASERAQLITDGNSLILNVTQGVLNLTWTGLSGAEWNNSTTNKPWTAPSPVDITAFTVGDNVIFDGTAAEKNISITAAVAPASIMVSGTETQTLTNTATGKITGASTLVKQDAGTLVITNGTNGLVNDFTGGVTISGGTVELTGSGPLLANGGLASALGASTKAAANLVLAGGATLKLNGTATSNITDRSFTLGVGGATLEAASASLTFFSDTAAIAHAGTGDRTLTLTGVSGASHIENGYGELNGGAIALQLTDPTGGKLGVVKTGTGIWSLQGNNTFTGGVTINGGMLLASSDTSFGAAPGTFTADAIKIDGGSLFNAKSSASSLFGEGANFTISANRGITIGNNGAGIRTWGASTLTIDSVITGTGSLRKWDSGTLVLNGASNTFTGGINLDGGTLQVAAGAIPHGAGMGGVTIANDATLALAGDSSYKDFYVNSLAGTGTIQNTAGTTGGNLLHVGFGTQDITYGGVIANGGGELGLVKAGTGTLTLSGTNTFSGGILVQTGILKAGSAGALGGSTDLAVQAGATLDVNGVSLDGTKTVVIGGTGTASQGALTSTATTALSVEKIVLSADTTVSTAGTMGLKSITTGSGATNLTLNGTAGYTAGVTDGININGKVILNTALTILASNAIVSSGQLDLGAAGSLLLDGSASQQLAALNGVVGSTIAHTETAGTGTLSIANAATNTVSSVIGGGTAQTAALNLSKSGGGTLILESSASTYTGITTINGGIVQLNAELSTGSGTGILGASSVVAADHLVIDGGTIHSVFSGPSQTARLFTIGAGGATLIADNGALQFNGTGAIAFASGATDISLTLSGDAAGSMLASVLGDTASGKTSLVKAGTGTWTLGGTNTYTGTTDLQSGAIILGADSALGTSALSMGAGTSLTLNGHSQTLSGLSSSAANASIVNGSGTAAILTVNNAIDQTYAGVLGDGTANGDNFAFAKGGAGKLTLTGSATYTGDTTVAGGTLHFNYPSANILGSNITVYDAATLDIASLTLGTGRTLTAGTSGSTTNLVGNYTMGDGSTLDISGTANTGRVLNVSGDLELQTGSTIVYSFTSNATGNNSQANVNNLVIGGEIDLSPIFVDDSLALGAYTIANYTSFSGTTDNIILSYIDPRYRITFTEDVGKIVMDVMSNSNDTPVYWTGAVNSGTPASPVYQWGGSGAAAANFVEAGSSTPHAFIAGEHAIFGDDNVGGRNVKIVTNGVYIGSATFDSEGDYTVSGGEMKGEGYLVKKGSGTLTLNSANSYKGARQDDGTFSAGTVLSAGTIVLGHQQALGVGQLLIHGGTLTTSSALPAIANDIAISDKATGVFNIAYDTVLSGALTGSGTLQKTGAESLRLTGDASNFKGRIDHTQGGMEITQGDYARTTFTLSGSGTSLLLDLAGNGTVKLGSLNGTAGTLVSASAGNKVLELGNINGSSAFAGDLVNGGGTIAVTKIGQSTVTLAGNNTYTGDTVVKEGVLQISGTFNSSNNIIIENGGTFALNQSAAQTIDTAIVSAGVFDKRGDNMLTLTADNTAMTGTVRITKGTLALANGGTLGTAVIENNGTLAYTTDGDTTIVSTISGSGDIRKQGTGEFTYLGNNSSTGGTYVEVGTLVIGDTTSSGNQVYKSSKVDLNGTDVVLNAGAGNTLSMGGGFTGSGTVTKEGDGVVTLAGRTTFEGIIHVNAGELHIGVGSANGTLENANSEIITADGTKLVFNRGSVATINGKISGEGIVENRGGNTGDGTIILAAENNIEGEILVKNRSTLQIGNGADSTARLADDNTDVTVTLDQGATLAYNKTGSTGERVTIQGDGSFEKRGNGELVFNSNAMYKGDTIVSGGTLVISTSQLPSSFADPSGSGFLQANEGGTLKLSNGGTTFDLSGRIRGNGTIVLSADSSIAAGSQTTYNYHELTDTLNNLRVEANTKLALGTSVGTQVKTNNLIIQSGGYLSGQGTITGNLQNYGTISPGNSTGTIVAGGNFINETTGVLVVEINSAFDYDSIHYKGSSQIKGGTVQLVIDDDVLADLVASAATINIIVDDDTGNNPLGQSSIGNFTGVNLNGILTYNNGSGISVLFANSIAKIPGLQLRDGLEGYVAYLDDILANPDRNPDLVTTVTGLLGAADKSTAINNSSPSGLASMTSMSIAAGHDDFDNLRSHLESLRYERGTLGQELGFTPYFQATGVFVRNGSGMDNPAFDFNTYGGFVGVDRSVGDKLILGVNAGYHGGTATIDNGGGKVKLSNGRVSAYGTYMFTDWVYMDAGVFGGYNSYDVKHDTVYGRATAKPDGFDVGASAYFGTIVPLSKEFHLTPYAGVEYIYTDVSSFTEEGSRAALDVDSFSQDSLRAKIGSGINWIVPTGAEFSLRLGLNVAYAYELLDTDADITARFANDTSGNKFKVSSPSTPEHAIQVGPSAEFGFADNMSLSFGYTLEYDFDAQYTHRLNATFRMRF